MQIDDSSAPLICGVPVSVPRLAIPASPPVDSNLPQFGGQTAQPQQQEASDNEQEEQDPDVVLEAYPNERQQIEEFGRAYEAMHTPVDLKDIMAGYLPAFLTHLHAVKKLCKATKYDATVAKAIRDKTTGVINSRIVESL